MNINTPHSLIQRVYYEDTDFSGLVYHAAYLKFLERARTEWLRERGFEQKRLLTIGFALVVTHLSIHYHDSAQMDDKLLIHTEVLRTTSARLIFSQSIYRHNDVEATRPLISAEVTIASINAEKKPVRLERLWATLEASAESFINFPVTQH